MMGWSTLMRRSFFSGVESELAAADARKSAIQNEIGGIAIDAYLGKAKAVRKFARLQAELMEINDRIDRLATDSREKDGRVRLEQSAPALQ
jgi:hypothetical protein